MDEIPTNPRTCLFVGSHPLPGQTFVNRHIEHMFGGNTCIISTDASSGENPYGKAIHDIAASRTRGLANILGIAPRLRNQKLYGTSHVPFGSGKAALERFLIDEGVEIILCEFGSRIAKIAPLAHEMDIPCFSYFRGRDATEELRKPRRARGYVNLLPMLDGIFAVSQYLLDQLEAAGLRHPNAHVIPSGVDIRKFRPAEKVPRSCLAVGRMVEKKSPLTTLRAFADATRDIPDAHLRFIGDGPLLAPTRKLAADLGVTDRVTFDGALPHDRVREALATSKVFLQHSVVGPSGDAEGLPTAIQEALACGCIIVSTRHAGIPEAVDHGVNGWMSEEHDLPGFTALIREALSGDHSDMTQAARRTAEERFDNAVLLRQVEDVLRDGLAAHRMKRNPGRA
ncbi:glycosyltransferase [Jannaschia sp. S6380]|uniref:glycosyltransferase n=1 Tax=Jannaschia sp. S6380 TaxID=2926408 RepID=UPI001FF108DA|nr:glycosyltransferase [Jannaschia sp. S6380]MCK0167022.1 glycosyltransferase [Jannaschia sp. S6380]